jgi:NADP-dependent 3-hydroxy acid dehydrogenase YdfG
MSYSLRPDPFTGKVITVTGAASGIGKATAELLWDRGASLSISDVDLDGLNVTKQALLDRSHKETQRVIVKQVDIRTLKSSMNGSLKPFGTSGDLIMQPMWSVQEIEQP